MEWIRDLKVGEGQTFTDAMKVPLAVLDQSAPFATGQRQGDLLAEQEAKQRPKRRPEQLGSRSTHLFRAPEHETRNLCRSECV